MNQDNLLLIQETITQAEKLSKMIAEIENNVAGMGDETIADAAEHLDDWVLPALRKFKSDMEA